MQNLTKSQVIALFLGASSAMTPMELLNGPSTEAGNADPENQAMTTSMSGSACNGNADCTVFGEKCGAFQRTDITAENFCVAKKYCGSLGRLNNVAWSLQCWETPTGIGGGVVATAPEQVVPEDLLAGLDTVITKNSPWEGVADLWVSSRFNYQDGWWIYNSETLKWTETDKPIDNRCYLDAQCGPLEGVERCCGTYPDTNNRRCMPKDQNFVSQTIGPLTFIPACATQEIGDVVPENAADDIAKGALAEASEELELWEANQLQDRQQKADFAAMDEAAQLAWTTEDNKLVAEADAFTNKLKGIMGYDDVDCSFDCQAAFNANYLEWQKQVYETCKADPVGIPCRNAREIREQEETARANATKPDEQDESGPPVRNHYYKDMTGNDREQFDKLRNDEIKALESSLAAAFIKDTRPEAGKEGSECSKEVKCTNSAHCCGTAKPVKNAFVTPEITGICVSTATGSYTDGLGREYTHTCGARALIATAAAAVTMAYSLM